MSDIRFNQWLHNSGTGGISQDSAGHVGIGTTVPTHINALTNNNSILHVGIVSCNTLNAASKIEGAIDDWIIHQSDTNTKFGFPTTDTFAAYTAGDERLRITSGGNIEVATTTATSPAYLRFNSNRSNADDALGGIHGIWNGNSVAGVNFKTGADTGNKDDGRIQFVTYTGGTPYTRMMILEDGKIGIGIDNPTSRLYVNGVSSSDIITARSADTNGNSVINILSEGTTGSSRILFSDTAAATGDAWISYSHTDRALLFTTAGTANERLRIRSDGRVQVKSGSAEVIAGEGASAELRLTADQGDDGADYWKIQSNHSTNNLNIATYTTGAYVDKFSMKTNGDIEATGNLKTNNITGKNLVINGSFQVDQWNNGSELSITSNTLFSADRWTHNNDGFTYYKTQRKNDGPIQTIGTEYYMRVTVTNAVTLSGNTSQCLENNLEGNTVRWLNLGTSGAKQCTVSFWVRCSLTGTFGGALVNSGYNRCHPFSYTISSANTWEYKTFTFTTTGFTTGSFTTGTGVGLRLVFSVGNGSGRQGATNQWHNGVKFGPTGETNLVATNGATMDIASVQLEEGTQATRFDHRSYQEEFLLCCRYYYRLERRFTAAGRGAGSSAYLASISTPVPLRAQPTIGKGTNTSGEGFSIRVYKYDGISDSSATPTVGTGGWAAGNNHITIYQGSHSVVDDRVLNIYMGGGYLDFNSEL